MQNSNYKKVPQKRSSLANAYVITEDLSLLVRRWCDITGIPKKSLKMQFFNSLFERLARALKECCFADKTIDVKALELKAFTDLLNKQDATTNGKKPREFWVSLDDVYVTPSNAFESKYNISVTRYVNLINEQWKQIGHGPRPEFIRDLKRQSLREQVNRCLKRHCLTEKRWNIKELQMFLIDDGTFDGGTICTILTLFAERKHHIESVRLGVGTTEGVEEIARWRYPKRGRQIKHTVPFIGASKLCPPILDWVCERDFFPGVLYSGKVVGTKDKKGNLHPLRVHGLPVRAQYLEGWGDIEDWATLKRKKGRREFTLRALELSIELWEKVQSLRKQKPILVKHLPAIPYRIYDKNPRRMAQVLKKPWLDVLREERDKLS